MCIACINKRPVNSDNTKSLVRHARWCHDILVGFVAGDVFHVVYSNTAATSAETAAKTTRKGQGMLYGQARQHHRVKVREGGALAHKQSTTYATKCWKSRSSINYGT